MFFFLDKMGCMEYSVFSYKKEDTFMDKIHICSRNGLYFLREDIGGYMSRVPLCKGRYKGTLEISESPTKYSWMYASLDQYTLHPEYCNVAWLQKNSGYYELVLYDRKVVTNRFLNKALTSIEDIQKAIFMHYRVHFEKLFIMGMSDNGTRHIATFDTYRLYTRLLEG